MHALLSSIYTAVLEGDLGRVSGFVEQALVGGLTPEQVLNEGMISAMTEVGQRFEKGNYFIPEMLIAAMAMKEGLVVLRPHLTARGVEPVGKVVIGTVQGDLHDIGKNLVAMMLEGAGFEVIDLGVDVGPQTFVDAVRAERPNLVALSALLTTTMPRVESTIHALRQADVHGDVRIIVGGAPVTPDYATQIHADGYAPNASQAVTLAKQLVEEVEQPG